MSMHQNLIRIKVINEQLKDLGQEFVFVGGATVSLYATNSVQKREQLKFFKIRSDKFF